MLSKEENELLTRVGPGTPAGEMLRRYWWPVGFTEHVKEKGRPVRTRLLGEDSVLFRDGNGRLGLLASTVHTAGIRWNSAESTIAGFGVVILVGSTMCVDGSWNKPRNRETAGSKTAFSI